MTTPEQLEAKFWKALNSDRTMMLGLDGVADGHVQPMTGLTDGATAHSPIWFFTTKDNGLVRAMSQGHRAVAHFVSRGHDLFATVYGELCIESDRVMVDRLWSPYVAAWFEGGKDDPKLQLLRLDPDHAHIWLDEKSLFAGARMLLGLGDPKAHYRDKVAQVPLH